MSFLEKLCECGLSSGYFIVCDVSEIETKCCNGLKVINFDKTAIKVCQGRISTLNSCDALKISKTKNCMDFIEFKKIEELIMRMRSPEECVKKMRKLGLCNKIFDSFVIIRLLMSFGEFKFTSEDFNDYLHVPKNLIVAIDTKLDTDPLESLKSKLVLLADIPNSPVKSAIDNLREIALKEINNQLREIEEDSNIRLNSVKLTTFQNIGKYYNNT